MKYAPLKIVSYCNDDCVSSNRHLWGSFADVGYDFFLWHAVKSELPVFRRNRILICFDPLREDRTLKIGGNIIPALLYSYDRNGIKDFLPMVRGKYADLLSALSLWVYGCTADEFMRDKNFPDAVKAFGEIVIRQETRDGTPLPSGISPRHFKRQRPCRYPFEWLTLDEHGNVQQCPYCRRVLTTFRGMDVLKKDPAFLRFLAAQLVMDFDEYPECRNCRYWLDGWLGDEIETFEYRSGHYATVSHEGHFCRISRMEEK